MITYYVYAYLRTDGTPYYIGKGKGRRVTEKHRISIPNKHRIVFLETNLSEIGALALERRYIRWYGRKDIGTGILRNLTDGGEGTSGRKMSPAHRDALIKSNRSRVVSDDTRRKLSELQRARTHSDETREKMSQQRKDRPHSTEHRRAISDAKKGVSKPKTVCRLSDRKEMDIANFTRHVTRHPQNLTPPHIKSS